MSRSAEPGPPAGAPPRSGAEQAGARVARNAAARTAGELIGKLASLVLFAVLTRKVTQTELGAFVAAAAWAQVVTTPVGIGLDRYLVRRVAKEHAAADALFFNTLRLKATRSLPVAALAVAGVFALGYDGRTRAAAMILTAGLLLNALARSVHALFTARERTDLTALVLIVQRIGAAALGLAALYAGFGIVTVALTFTIGEAVGLALAALLLGRRLGMPRRDYPSAARAELRSGSRPFAAQDFFGVFLARADVVLLSLLVAAAVVGRYGAAYRLLESTFFVSLVLTASFSAMFTYLDRESDPTVQAVFQRAIKLAACSLIPIAVAFGVLAEPVTRAFFGAGLADAAPSLRLLAAVVVLQGVTTVSLSLLASRRSGGVLVRLVGGMSLLNVVLNLALIPPLEERGAALAMLLTYAAFAALALRAAVVTVGGVRWTSMVGAPLVAGAAMAGTMAALAGTFVVALGAGTLVYLVALVALERAIDPADLRFVSALARRGRAQPAVANLSEP